MLAFSANEGFSLKHRKNSDGALLFWISLFSVVMVFKVQSMCLNSADSELSLKILCMVFKSSIRNNEKTKYYIPHTQVAV